MRQRKWREIKAINKKTDDIKRKENKDGKENIDYVEIKENNEDEETICSICLGEIDDDFTTCYTAGKAVSKPIDILPETEKKSLLQECQIVLDILNSELREKYKNIIELGADFILVGDGNSVMLGEINHHCPALIPISEAMSEENYEEGLGFTKRAVRDSLSRS